MENQQLLDEAKFKKFRKTINIIAICIAVIGLTIGCLLIGFGGMKMAQAEEEYSKAISHNLLAINTPSEVDEIDADELFNEMKNYADSYVEDVDEDYNQQDQESTGAEIYDEQGTSTTGLFDEFNKQRQKNDAEFEAREREFDASQKKMEAQSNAEFMILGGVTVILFSLMGAGGLLLFANMREILAFKTQQVMPVAQEGIEKITPTIAKSSGAVAGSVAENAVQGIKKGLKDGE